MARNPSAEIRRKSGQPAEGQMGVPKNEMIASNYTPYTPTIHTSDRVPDAVGVRCV